MDQEMHWEPEADQELQRRVEMMGWDATRAAGLRRHVERIAGERDSRVVSVADLNEARDRSMQSRQRRLSDEVQQLEWDSDARLELEKETIYLRERLRERVLALVEKSGEQRVTLAHVGQARRMPSGMAAMRAAQPSPEEEPTPVPPWPVTFGTYRLKDLEGSVAICTLASEALMDELAPLPLPGVAILGRAFTENFGVEKLVTNIVTNPRLRTLILCGTESRHRVGQTLIALHENGRDDEGKVVGADSPLPSVRSLSNEAVRIYQEKVTIVDLRDEMSTETIIAEAESAASAGREPWPEKWEPEVPAAGRGSGSSGASGGGMAGRFTPDATGFFLIGLGPWGDTIEMEHYTRDGDLDHRVSAGSAQELCSVLTGANLVGDITHALYLGREIYKADLALNYGLEYQQDRALEWPAPAQADRDNEPGKMRSM